ncbi:MAG: hypothetical protein HQL73_07910, partial [Magnetococcales bacterium]|nr:hypothetical protein [Magnetococcales bacterium]
MKITLSDQDGFCHVMVQGDRLNDGEESQILAIMHQPRPLPLRLYFYELQWISSTLTLGIHQTIERDPKNEVHIFNRHLFSYLFGLGISVRLIPAQGGEKGLEPSFRALVLGGSAGSLDKMIHLIKHLPPSDAVVFVVQHVAEDKPNLLDRLLRQHTEYTVLMPHHMIDVVPGTIYVAPPGHHMRVAHGLLYLTRDKKVKAARPSIDILFESVALEYGPQTLALMLCGYGRDGIAGAQAVIRHQGTLMALSHDSCQEGGILVEATAREVSGASAVSLPVMTALVAASVSKGMAQSDLIPFFTAVAAVYGHHYGDYQPDMLKRRLGQVCNDLGVSGSYQCQKEILTSYSAFQKFFLALSINVTEFFRMPHQFRLLKEEIFPYLASFPHIRIWIAGSSSGEEVYSLAALLHESGLLHRCLIYATDINPFILMQAANGLYPLERMQSGRENYLKAGGNASFDDYCLLESDRFFSIHPVLRHKILFYRHSLAVDGPFNEFQLIMCRNLLIYFNTTLQKKVMELFDRSLHSDGILLLGDQETIHPGDGGRFFSEAKKGFNIYSRTRRALTGVFCLLLPVAIIAIGVI